MAFRNIAISSFWTNPLYFWSFYLPKLAISALLGSLVFLFRRKYWTIYVSVIINLWILAEVVYYRSTWVFITADSFVLLKELHGFESSIEMYMTPDLLLLLIPTLLLIVAVVLFDNRNRSLPAFVSVLVCSVGMDVVGCNAVARQIYPDEKHWYFSCYQTNFCSGLFLWNPTECAVRFVSVLHSFYYTVVDLACKPFAKPMELTAADIETAKAFCDTTYTSVTPSHPLILVLVESLEGWAVRPDIMPNLYRFVQQHNVVYASHTKSQTLAGNSADGQMLFNTGLMPLREGVVVNDYSQNTFPSLSEIYSRSAMIQPGDLGIWNQFVMNVSYSIDTAYQVISSLDGESFQVLDSISKEYNYVLLITAASHTPFAYGAQHRSLSLPAGMPENMQNYLQCIHYTDSCWGGLLQRIDTDSVLHNSVVCFMGDHIIFDPIMRQGFQDYCDDNGLDYKPREAYTAFVAYSPELTQSVVVDEETYQMDAYPTILHLIGAENYYWKGFGVNLADTTAVSHRAVTEQEAYNVSEKLIRSDYFRRVKR